MNQQGPQSIDRFVVHWYVIALENPCQLSRQLTCRTDLWHVGFCWFLWCWRPLDFSLVVWCWKSKVCSRSFPGPFWCAPPLWSYPPSLILNFFALCKITDRFCSIGWFDSQFRFWSVCVTFQQTFTFVVPSSFRHIHVSRKVSVLLCSASTVNMMLSSIQFRRCVNCSTPLSSCTAISSKRIKLNAGHHCSMRDVKILQLQRTDTGENSKRPLTYTGGCRL